MDDLKGSSLRRSFLRVKPRTKDHSPFEAQEKIWAVQITARNKKDVTDVLLGDIVDYDEVLPSGWIYSRKVPSIPVIITEDGSTHGSVIQPKMGEFIVLQEDSLEYEILSVEEFHQNYLVVKAPFKGPFHDVINRIRNILCLP